MLAGDNGIINNAQISKARTAEEQVREEISLAWAEIQTSVLVDGGNVSEKAGELDTILEKNGSSATVSYNNGSYKIKYKGYNATLNTETGEITLVKAGGQTNGLTVGQAYDDVLIKIGDKFKYTGDTQTEWIVFGKDEEGNVLLTTDEPVEDKKFTLNADAQHWLSYEDDLHNFCSIYGDVSKGIEGRSITIEDINRVTGYTEPTLNSYTFGTEQDYENYKVNYYYPTTETATAGTYPYWKKATNESESKTFTEIHGYYYYYYQSGLTDNTKYVIGGYWETGHESEGESSEYYHSLKHYKVASRSVRVSDFGATFCSGVVYRGFMGFGYNVVNTSGIDFSCGSGFDGVYNGYTTSVSVRPIVVFPSTIKVQEGQNGVYELAE